MAKVSVDFFTKEASKGYDERNRQLSPITDNLHFLIRLHLRELPENARVLCVGIGTGADILSLAAAFPKWTFVGVDPSGDMLDVCRERLAAAGVSERCELIRGFVQDVPVTEKFDAVVTLLVAHFVKLEERAGFYKAMVERLKPRGHIVSAEISFDLDSPEFPAMLKNWEAVQTLMGVNAEGVSKIPQQLREMLSVISPEKTKQLLEQAGVELPQRFFQAFMICGWFGRKA